MTPDAVPTDVRTAAMGALSARERGAVLADLVIDSMDDEQSAPRSRSLVFAGGGLRVDLSLDRDPTTRATSVQVGVTWEEQATSWQGDIEVDVRGRATPAVLLLAPGLWVLRFVTPGPLRLVVQRATYRVQTSWIRC